MMNFKTFSFLPFGAGIFLTIVVIGSFSLFQEASMSLPNQNQANEIIQVYQSLTPKAQALYYQQSEELTKKVSERLVELDLLQIGCFGPSKIMNMSSEETNLGGQCCGALKNAEAYEIQLQALERFISENGNIELIPRDPYDLTVEQAQQLTVFDQSLQLTAEQQAIYDQAVGMSHHGGPCCCKCWKWYVMSGLAKHLIGEYSWTSEQIAELWDLSSSCGHDADTDMHKHYDSNKH